MTPASFFTGGTAGQQWAEKENRKAPSVAGGAQKISVRGIQRTRNLFGSPAQGGLKNEREAHHGGRAIETAHSRVASSSIQFHDATAFETAWRAPGQAQRGATIRLTQPD